MITFLLVPTVVFSVRSEFQEDKINFIFLNRSVGKPYKGIVVDSPFYRKSPEVWEVVEKTEINEIIMH
jgi:hypothetical protein